MNLLKRFKGLKKNSLTKRISNIEAALVGKDLDASQSLFPELDISSNLLEAAITFKQVAGQINVLIHAAGILLSLPYILQEGEIIESLSLGAGNTGRLFDLETNYRVAEYKFINWQGGPEAIRQNSLFKDFYLLAEYETSKKKFLYVVGTKYPIKFFESKRSLKSIMSRNIKLWTDFQTRYGDQFATINEYYKNRNSIVIIEDISKIIPQFQNFK